MSESIALWLMILWAGGGCWLIASAIRPGTDSH